MSASVVVHIHSSQFPRAVAEAFAESLRTRRMNHKFHYDTAKQTLRWLRVHEAFSPARLDATCLAAYAQAMQAAVAEMAVENSLEIISLGCGGGQKEAQLLQALRAANSSLGIHYVPSDVSVGLALVARDAAMVAGLHAEQCSPLVLDLATTNDWRAAFADVSSDDARRLITFFGMMPNFLPNAVLPQLRDLLAVNDLLLVSANLAPGDNYAGGVERVRPLYDNELTREWLLGVLLDLGVEREDGRMEFRVVACPEGSGLLRIEACFHFTHERRVHFNGADFSFAVGESFQLFFSYRHTVAHVTRLFAENDIAVLNAWTNVAGDEGVFLCRRGDNLISMIADIN